MANLSDDDAEEIDAELSESGESYDDKGRTAKSFLDLQVLFDTEKLKSFMATIVEDSKVDVITKHKDHIIHWLSQRLERNEETISLAQFCDALSEKQVSREDCTQAFNELDTEGDGHFDIKVLHERLKNDAYSRGELTFVDKVLSDCIHIPGFIDVYSSNEEKSANHGAQLLDYLLRNRALSKELKCDSSAYRTISNRRHLALRKNIELLNSANESAIGILDGDGIVILDTKKCISSLEASSNQVQASGLLEGSMWSSNGSAGSHWIRLRIAPGVLMKKLYMLVKSEDSSYMPEEVVVSVGSNRHSMKEHKKFIIPRETNGNFLIMDSAKIHYPYIQVNIKRCHSTGSDTKIHGFKAVGHKVTEKGHKELNIDNTMVAWYLRMLSSISMACLPVMPQLRVLILQHTREAVEEMPPLSISPDSRHRPKNISPTNYDEIHSLIHNLSINADGGLSPEGLAILLSFNLARGAVGEILKTLVEINNTRPELDVGKLLLAMDEAKKKKVPTATLR